MSDLIKRLRSRRRYATVEELHEAADEIERLKAELFTMRNVFHQQDAEIEGLRAVVDAAKAHLYRPEFTGVIHTSVALHEALAALEGGDE
jgi:3-dehydroquinate dehydratase